MNKALAVVLLLLSAAPTLATNTAPERRSVQVPVEDEDFDEWGLLGLLGLAGLLGLRRREYTDKDYVGKTGYDRTPGA